MQTEDLSGVDAQVFQAIAELEDEQGAPHAQDIARHTGLDVEQTREALHRLTTDRGIVHEVRGATQPDLGPVYELSPRT